MVQYISSVTPSAYRAYQHAVYANTGQGVSLTTRDGWPPINDPKNVSGWSCYGYILARGLEASPYTEVGPSPQRGMEPEAAEIST